MVGLNFWFDVLECTIIIECRVNLTMICKLEKHVKFSEKFDRKYLPK